MRMSFVMTLALFGISTAGATPPGPSCQEMADKASHDFAMERRSSDIGPAKCRAISLVISQLQDMASKCGADKKFREETYMPLAKAVGAEAPQVCRQ